MKRVLLGAVLVGLLVPLAARADLEEGAFAPDVDAVDWLNTDGKSLSISELRGMVVVLYFWESWQPQQRYLLRSSNFAENQLRQAGVFLIGVTSAGRRTVEDLIRQEHIFFPIALGSRAAEAYKIEPEDMPRVVIIDPSGAVVFSGPPNVGTVTQKVQKLVFEEAPPFRTHPRHAEKARKALEAAREALKREDYQEAFVKAREAEDLALADDRLKLRCQEMIDLVDAIGRDRLHQGLALIETLQYEEGVKVINEVIKQFQVAGCGKAARRRLRLLKDQYPQVRQVADKLGREDEAHTKLVSAAEKLWRRKFGEAYSALQKIEEEYSGTKAAETAKVIRDRIDANKTLRQIVLDNDARKVCEDRLARARNFIETRRYEDARKTLRSIIDEFPQTSYVEEAYRLLSEIP
ncbi:MAG: redoxin domain-containing protein [Phycisphaerae bacterium]|mgnify:CR=1 FL=1|nr:redoxin domain-containing protein [Phycisphaerae bacterium]HOO15688.1 redoxin domain-containing protein [Phycisphaerae bacterium]HPC21845.1 redoxin domain-containing protein [Phycisphaerae bacterium]HRS26938.1 redoxin domain-containing protein [Phycisphaerae bacterium]HRT40941.1 redoxin domain-containing protein [Phycisphaerae bacterium]